MALKVELSSQRFIELLMELSIVELLNFSTRSRREGVTLPILWYLSLWLTHKTKELKSNKGNFTFPVHRVNVIEL